MEKHVNTCPSVPSAPLSQEKMTSIEIVYIDFPDLGVIVFSVDKMLF